ncbi:hypothetical protein EPN15_04275 [Patescibacteria group bacterium]|nr:MAG: hypothetical protein EPN15_04275 [Patescibacteria group bacterium]
MRMKVWGEIVEGRLNPNDWEVLVGLPLSGREIVRIFFENGNTSLSVCELMDRLPGHLSIWSMINQLNMDLAWHNVPYRFFEKSTDGSWLGLIFRFYRIKPRYWEQLTTEVENRRVINEENSAR